MALPTYGFSGIVSTADQSHATYLPLQSLDVHVFIADVSARVILSQVYSHHGPDVLTEAFYVFPVPARAAVCSFELETRHGVQLKGVVKELSQAKEEYEEARSKGWLTGLLEQFRQDVFVVSIGSMPPDTDVTVLLSYVVDLSEDDQIDTVRFQLSSHVRARYGAPENSILYHEKTHRAPLSITVDIEMPGAILVATSQNHNPFYDVPPSVGTSRSPHIARKQFISGDLFDLQKDFLLIVHALGLGRPRCFSEKLSHEENSLRGVAGPTTALACTIVPQFDISTRTSAHEYLFLIDRSGSMAGIGISMARETLNLLLTQLPSTTDGSFNIYGFGSTYTSQWPVSRPYADANLREAKYHVSTMEANLGGTEMLGALQAVFRSRKQNIPTSLFVLTDGFIYDIDTTVEALRQVVTSAPVRAPLRVFALGMGSGASTELCQKLAVAGNGSYMMTVEGEPLTLKALSLVNAMKTPQVSQMSVDWGSLGQVRQAPHRIPALSPGTRFLVTAIIPGGQVPTQVAIKLGLADGTTLDYDVPVQPLSHTIPASFTEALGGQENIPPLIHTLSAHLLIQDVEGGDKKPLEMDAWRMLTPQAQRDVVKRYIVDLGTQYQIASSRTAFVAIAVPKPSGKPPGNRANNTNRGDSQSKSGSHTTSQGGGSTGAASSGPESNNGQSSGTQGKSNTNGSTSGFSKSKSGNGHASGAQGSQSPAGGNANANSSALSGGGTPSKKDTTHSSKISKSSPDTQRSSQESKKSSQSHSSASGTSSDTNGTQSKSPTSNMPGAFKSSPYTGKTASGGLFDFFAHRPPPESAAVQEVLCIPDPQGGGSMVFTAPPLPRYTTITMITTSWLKSLRSFIFSKSQPNGARGGASRANQTASASVTRHASIPREIVAIINLQSSLGSFSGVTPELSSIVGVPQSTLHDSMPSMAYGGDNESLWATAIAIAFCRKRLGLNVALWEGMADKAHLFGSTVCGGRDKFEAVVQTALKLFEG